MSTYKCNRCGHIISLPIKPGRCEQCGASQFRMLGANQDGTPSSDISSCMSGSITDVSESILPSSSGKFALPPPPPKIKQKLASHGENDNDTLFSPQKSSFSSRKSQPPSDSLIPPTEPRITPKSSYSVNQPPAFSNSEKQTPKTKSSSVSYNFPSKNRSKKSNSPSLPKYSPSTHIDDSEANKSGPKSSAAQKQVQQKKKQQVNLQLPWQYLIPLLILLMGLAGYWKWQSQFDTKELQKIVLKETFKPAPKNWALTTGAKFKDGGLFHEQPQKNLRGTSFWKGKDLADLDFSAEVVKATGPNDLPFGLVAKINGSGQSFYYFLINGKGDFLLGKNSQGKFQHKVGWKKSNMIKTGNKGKNQLRLVAKGDLIIGYINGKRVGSFRDSSYSSGKVGVFSMRGSGAAAAIYFDNIIVKERVLLKKSASPKQAIDHHIQNLNQINDPLNPVKKVSVYATKTIEQSEQKVKLQVWLKHEMKNGAVVCENRVVILNFNSSQESWIISNWGQPVEEPSCKL